MREFCCSTSSPDILLGQRVKSCTRWRRRDTAKPAARSSFGGATDRHLFGRSLSRHRAALRWCTYAGNPRNDEFLNWFNAGGGHLRDDVTVWDKADGQLRLGVFASGGQLVVHGEPFVVLPHGLRIDAATADASAVGGLWRWTNSAARAEGLAWAPDDMADILGECLLQGVDPLGPFRREVVRIALFLLAEQANPSSPWAPYLSLFPTVNELSNHGLFWTEEQLVGFGDMGLVEVALRQQSAVRSMYEFFVEPGFTCCTGLPLPSLEQFNRAVAIAESRVLYDSSASLEALCCSDPGGAATGGSACALLPVIELAGLQDSGPNGYNCAFSTETNGSTLLTGLSSVKSGKASSTQLCCRRWRGGVVPAYVSLVQHGTLPALSSSTIASHLLFPETPFGNRMADDMRKAVGSGFPWWRPFQASVEAVEKECVSLLREYLTLDPAAETESLYLKYRVGKALAIGYAGIARYEAKKGEGKLPDKVLARGKAGYNSTDRATQLFWRSVLDHRREEAARRERGEEANTAVLDV